MLLTFLNLQIARKIKQLSNSASYTQPAKKDAASRGSVGGLSSWRNQNVATLGGKEWGLYPTPG